MRERTVPSARAVSFPYPSASVFLRFCLGLGQLRQLLPQGFRHVVSELHFQLTFQLFLPENYMNLVFNFWMSPYVFIYSWVGQNIFVKLVSIFILPFFCWLGYRTARSGNNLFKKLSDKLLVLVYQKK